MQMFDNKVYSEIIDKRLFFCFVIWFIAMGSALADFNSHSLRPNGINAIILPLVLLYFIRITKFKFYKIAPLLLAFGILFLWQMLLIYKYGSYNILIGRTYDVLFSFIVIRAIGLRRFCFYFEAVVAKLCIVSLILWILIVLFPFIIQPLCGLSFPINQTGTQIAHWGIVGISNSENLGLIRNLGFAWEPGRFSSIVCIALMLHLFRQQFQLFKPNFWPLILGILTSLSSTGYMTLIACIIGYYYNAQKDASSVMIKNILVIGFVLMVVSSPFLLDKMTEISDPDTFLTEGAADYYSKNDIGYVPQRAEGLYLDYLNIIDSPLFGYGDDVTYSYICRVVFPSLKISLSDGLLQIIAMMGIPLGLLFYFSLWKSSELFSRMYNIKGKFLLFMVICLVNVSYNFFYEPLFVCMVLYCLFLPDSDKAELGII